MRASTGESKPATLLTPYTFIGSDPAIFEQSLRLHPPSRRLHLVVPRLELADRTTRTDNLSLYSATYWDW